MAINIKELFVTDLNPNSNFWWSRDKVDKINYNFDQLSNGGMPGPQGTIGVDGGFGPAGTQGFQGFKGPQGFQGVQGAESSNDWVLFPEADGLPGYLYPRKNPPTISQAVPVALRIGYINDATDPDYGVGAAAINSPAQTVKVKDNWMNLRVEDNNDINGYNFSFRKSLAGSRPVFEISPNISSANFKIIWTAKTTIFWTGTTVNSMVDSIKITDSQITINTGNIAPPEFILSNDGINTNKITKSENQFRFTPNAYTDKVLVSTDTFGNVEWKDVKEVFGTFPIGSIISIRPSEFVTAHFWLDDAVSATLGSPLNNIYGRGKLGTDYEGWYLCNGETWETPSGFNGTLTPNLNNFTYTIDANGDAQYVVTSLGADTTPIILGGYDMRITAIPDSAGVYTVGYTSTFSDNNTSPGNDTINMGNSGNHYTSRMIHIVYLGLTNLKWTNSGSGVVIPPPVNNTIMLGQATGPAAICSTPVTTLYSWTGNNDWNTFTVVGSTYQLFLLGTTTYAPFGWYVNADGYPIRWNNTAGAFMNRGIQCQPTITEENLRYSLLVDELNGPLSTMGGQILYLDMSNPTGLVTSLDQATSLVWSDDQILNPPGSPADAGWYRDINTGVRRYWSGSAFEGASFTQDWVNRVYFNFGANGGVIDDPGYNNASSTGGSLGTPVCSVLQTQHVTYVAGDEILVVPLSSSQAQNIRDYQHNLGDYLNAPYGPSFGSALYVPLNWTPPLYDFINQDIANTPPLINVAEQFRPGSTTQKYSKVYLDDTYWASITQTTGTLLGKIGTSLGNC